MGVKILSRPTPADLERDGRRELGPVDAAEQHGVDNRVVRKGPVEHVAVDADLVAGPLDHTTSGGSP